MKVFGVDRGDGVKDYVIEHNGVQHLCTRQANGKWFELHGQLGTMKSLKKYVETLGDEPEAPQEAAEPVMNREWRTDPAALLAMLYEGMTVDRDAIMDTLDSWGYVTPAGEIDTESARKTFKASHEDKIYE